MVDCTNTCRVCLRPGNLNIFTPLDSQRNEVMLNMPRSSSELTMAHKLRYVTMAQIKERDGFPEMLCNTCMLGLNVAYSFKRQAVENIHKLERMYEENGISTNTTQTLLNEDIPPVFKVEPTEDPTTSTNRIFRNNSLCCMIQPNVHNEHVGSNGGNHNESHMPVMMVCLNEYPVKDTDSYYSDVSKNSNVTNQHLNNAAEDNLVPVRNVTFSKANSTVSKRRRRRRPKWSTRKVAKKQRSKQY